MTDDGLPLTPPPATAMYPAEDVQRYVEWAEATIAGLRAALASAGAGPDACADVPAEGSEATARPDVFIE